jgi:Zn-dependent protease
LNKVVALQTSKPNWLYSLLILGISILLFVGASRVDRATPIPWLLIPILLFHELGHYVTMRAFGYRNLRMFFIPFFGAAVSGKHYNVAGWKKAVVALAGPVPGILAGGVIGVVGLILRNNSLLDAAALCIALNGFNLLPLLPFDGGWVLLATLFCRHPLLDTAFRALAVLGVGALGILDARLYLLAGLLAFVLPVSWRLAQVAYRLRKKGGIVSSPDDVTIPLETARVILNELKAGRPTRAPVNIHAQQVLTVFETLNARPPSAMATLGLLAVHGGSFLLALVLLVVFIAGRMGWFHHPRGVEPEAPLPYEYKVGAAREWHGTAVVAAPPAASITLAAVYNDENAARAEFAALPAELPPQASLQFFGTALLLTLPENQQAQRARWVERLGMQARSVLGKKLNSPIMLSMSVELSQEAEAEILEQDLSAFFGLPDLLLAPWSAEWKWLPAKELDRFQKARRTKARLDLLYGQAMQQPSVEAARQEMAPRLFRKNDTDPHKYLQAIEAEEDRLFAELAAERETTIDPAIVKLYERLRQITKDMSRTYHGAGGQKSEEQVKTLYRERRALEVEMAQHMGPAPLDGNRTRPGDHTEASFWGRVTRLGCTILIRDLFLPHNRRELPALADWLGQCEGCRVRYDLREISPDR